MKNYLEWCEDLTEYLRAHNYDRDINLDYFRADFEAEMPAETAGNIFLEYYLRD